MGWTSLAGKRETTKRVLMILEIYEISCRNTTYCISPFAIVDVYYSECLRLDRRVCEYVCELHDNVGSIANIFSHLCRAYMNDQRHNRQPHEF